MRHITTRQVLRAIGDDRIALYRGEGYWYFAFDEPGANKFETLSIWTPRLNDMPLHRWVEDGRKFLADMVGREVGPHDPSQIFRVGGL